MSDADRDEGATWRPDQDGEHPAGELAPARRTMTGARARALSGLGLAVGAYVAVAVGIADTTVSAPGMR
ncbi:hypothetical protein [Actinosynnema sp. NPDC020468]|uniref:hypothetical protein n=1 Tax=Actinosynnema sp. NPDC020468 TaxID=3154488 RepID=UPI0033FDEF7D